MSNQQFLPFGTSKNIRYPYTPLENPEKFFDYAKTCREEHAEHVYYACILPTREQSMKTLKTKINMTIHNLRYHSFGKYTVPFFWERVLKVNYDTIASWKMDLGQIFAYMACIFYIDNQLENDWNVKKEQVFKEQIIRAEKAVMDKTFARKIIKAQHEVLNIPLHDTDNKIDYYNAKYHPFDEDEDDKSGDEVFDDGDEPDSPQKYLDFVRSVAEYIQKCIADHKRKEEDGDDSDDDDYLQSPKNNDTFSKLYPDVRKAFLRRENLFFSHVELFKNGTPVSSDIKEEKEKEKEQGKGKEREDARDPEFDIDYYEAIITAEFPIHDNGLQWLRPDTAQKRTNDPEFVSDMQINLERDVKQLQKTVNDMRDMIMELIAGKNNT